MESNAKIQNRLTHFSMAFHGTKLQRFKIGSIISQWLVYGIDGQIFKRIEMLRFIKAKSFLCVLSWNRNAKIQNRLTHFPMTFHGTEMQRFKIG